MSRKKDGAPMGEAAWRKNYKEAAVKLKKKDECGESFVLSEKCVGSNYLSSDNYIPMSVDVDYCRDSRRISGHGMGGDGCHGGERRT